ncbi:hypothetical protein GGX14DRAFT_551716 [Mycena pura]|uniref:Pre-mRNA polyadenylation factor Fip1 domain-containing protein n=1 Tax=Mycena pura TaxID=153505 RepID=A0AAD6YDR3_9AGAR|nr:hypothetical protein GGX14DRAFT_551716 [Mycena pura]
MDDDDDFLYGGGTPQPESTPTPALASLASIPPSQGIIAQLKAQADVAEASTSQATDVFVSREDEVEVEQDIESPDADMGETDDEDDVEIIMEPQARSLDFRQANARSTPLRSSGSTQAIKAPQPSLTTEYTPIQRAAPPPSSTPSRATPQSQPTPQPTPQAASSLEPPPPAAASASIPHTAEPPVQTQTAPEGAPADGEVDPTTLPPVTAPPSHPVIDPTATGTMEGRSIIDVDLSSMTDKAWRRPGSDISDWFNYGFDELSWEAYCYRRRDLGELANVLKTNVLNFSGMPEDQLTALPPEVRTMVMTGTTAMMNGAGNAMMGQGMMMDMGGMMGPMGMGMNGDMGMNAPMMPMGMQDGVGAGTPQGPGAGGAGTPEQAGGMMQEGGFVGGTGMMGMGMEFPQEQNQMAPQQQMYPQMDAPGPGPQAVPGPPAAHMGRGGGAGAMPYRGGRGLRGARGFAGRGRGRGYGDAAPPVRPTSPLPPNVPTGPRNQNKYKDRDGNAAAVDGLDYGGTKDRDYRTPSGEPEERSRKRRSSPGLDDGRGSKRR